MKDYQIDSVTYAASPAWRPGSNHYGYGSTPSIQC